MKLTKGKETICMMDKVQNKIVVITGGAGGLGSEHVKILLENGAKVAIVDLPTSQGQTQATELQGKYGKGRVVFFSCNVTKAKEVETMFRKVSDEFGEFDILVNNAGMLNENILEQVIDLNVISVIRNSLLAMDCMGKHKGGKGGVIVNISSIAGLTTQDFYVPIYCATKHAVTGFSNCMANFYNITGVRILTLCPGVTMTPLVTNELYERLLNSLKSFTKGSTKLPQQTADNVSQALLHLIQKGENGAIWVSEAGQPPYAVNIPHYSKQAMPV